MVVKPLVLAVVPARGGSKSIPAKNVKRLGGHPLLAYSIAAGLQSRSVHRVLVSTDDHATAEIAKHYGADVPFLRPRHLAEDDTLDLPVFEHVLHELALREAYVPDYIVQLRPTSPFRPHGLVDQSVALLEATPEADSVRGVVPATQNPYKMWRVNDRGALQPLLTEIPYGFNWPRQHLPNTFWQSGHIDTIRRETIVERQSMTGRAVWPMHIDARYTIDIDTPADWERAEALAGRADLDFVHPGGAKRRLPDAVKMVVLDFDGVITDNRVWVDTNGTEMIVADRGDGMGIATMVKAGIAVVVLSKEANPVVGARCRKLGLAYLQGIDDKPSALRTLMHEHGSDASNTIYVGNDVNDVPCFPLVACAIVVADAHASAIRAADLVLTRRGGRGALRELSDLLLTRDERKEPNAC